MQTIIKCPYCDAEYLPGEIFLPDEFLGQPTDVEKDYKHQILFNGGKDQNVEETYTCDYCGKQFTVKADINYKVDKVNAVDFSSDYETIKESKLTLKED